MASGSGEHENAEAQTNPGPIGSLCLRGSAPLPHLTQPGLVAESGAVPQKIVQWLYLRDSPAQSEATHNVRTDFGDVPLKSLTDSVPRVSFPRVFQD